MSSDPLAEMEARILDAITTSENRLRADFLFATPSAAGPGYPRSDGERR